MLMKIYSNEHNVLNFNTNSTIQGPLSIVTFSILLVLAHFRLPTCFNQTVNTPSKTTNDTFTALDQNSFDSKRVREKVLFPHYLNLANFFLPIQHLMYMYLMYMYCISFL